MRNMDKVSFPYRSATHLAFLHVVGEAGGWARHGLDVDYNRSIAKDEAHHAVSSGAVEFVGGNHISTYGHRARGDNWVYLGQTLNAVHCKLAVRPDSGINSVADLRGKKIGIRGAHPALNDWLFLKQRGLDVDRDDVELVEKVDGLESAEDAEMLEGPEALANKHKERAPLWHWIRDKKVDAALLMSPGHLFAEEMGLKIIDLEPLPMIWYTTISSSLPFVEKHPDIVERFLKGLIEGVHFMKTQPEKSIKIIQEKHTKEGQLNHAQATWMYHDIAPMVDANLYPTMSAIANVYEEAKRHDADAEKVNPMELWDLHHLRRIADSGFVDQLYGRKQADKNAADPEYQKEQKKKQAEVVAAVKACGHAANVDCGCH
jgi:ABC-type nitrate/sulfonate/bicarbonate transport system substrate-binding protein